MKILNRMFSPFVIISIGLIGLIIGFAIPNLIVFFIFYYITVSSVFFFYSSNRKDKYIENNLVENFWENEKMVANRLADISEEIPKVNISREYFDNPPHSRHQTVYHTSPNPKFER